jgi:cobalamin biosynthesis protein CobT
MTSDGAPVVDSTLSANAEKYLERRLQQIVDIERRSPFDPIARRQSRRKHTEANGLAQLRGGMVLA